MVSPRLLICLGLALCLARPGYAGEATTPGRVCFAFAGDLMHHRAQAEGARTDPKSEALDYGRSLARLTPLLESADFAVANLESPIDGLRKHHFYPRFSAPKEYLDAIRDAGFDLLSLANNHALDRGAAGLVRTLLRIQARGMQPVGVSPDHEIAVVEHGGVTTAILAYTTVMNRCCPCRRPPCPVFLDLHRSDERGHKSLQESVRDAARRYDAVVVILHWMREFRANPLPRHRRLAQALVDAGALVVIGHHSHVLGPARLLNVAAESLPEGTSPEGDPETDEPPGPVRRAYVRYSLGNLVTAMEGYPDSSGGIDVVCLEKEGGVTTVAEVAFHPLFVRRHLATGERDVFQVMPLDEARRECRREGKTPWGHRRRECRQIGAFRKYLSRNRRLHPASPKRARLRVAEPRPPAEPQRRRRLLPAGMKAHLLTRSRRSPWRWPRPGLDRVILDLTRRPCITREVWWHEVRHGCQQRRTESHVLER